MVAIVPRKYFHLPLHSYDLFYVQCLLCPMFGRFPQELAARVTSLKFFYLQVVIFLHFIREIFKNIHSSNEKITRTWTEKVETQSTSTFSSAQPRSAKFNLLFRNPWLSVTFTSELPTTFTSLILRQHFLAKNVDDKMLNLTAKHAWSINGPLVAKNLSTDLHSSLQVDIMAINRI